MRQFDTQTTLEEHPVDETAAAARSHNEYLAIEYQPPLVLRAEAARWAIKELGIDPWLALSHVVWPDTAAKH